MRRLTRLEKTRNSINQGDNMEKLKRLTLSFILMSVVAVAASAGETEGPPAPGQTEAPPCAPGELQGPPCSSQSANNDSTAPGEILNPPASDTVDLVDIAEAAFWSLTLF
jgi:hypothetical protein